MRRTGEEVFGGGTRDGTTPRGDGRHCGAAEPRVALDADKVRVGERDGKGEVLRVAARGLEEVWRARMTRSLSVTTT